MTITVKCPNCARKIEWSSDNRWRPFCSERCKLIDLGAWASEEHVIAGSTLIETYEATGDAVSPDNNKHHE